MRRIILILVLFLLPALSWADEFVLVKGKGIPVCEAHLKNLKSLAINEMVCWSGRYPEANGITRPKWEQLDLRKNKELLRKIKKFFIYGDQFAKDKALDNEKGFEMLIEHCLGCARFRGGQLQKSDCSKEFPAQYALYITKADIDNDGTAEKILLFREQICMLSGAYSRPLLVLDEEKDLIDVKQTEPLLDPLKKYTDIKVKTSLNYKLYDVFFYKNKAYFDRWDVDDWTLTVYHLSKNRVKEVCKYYLKEEKL